MGAVCCQVWPLPAQQSATTHFQLSQNKNSVGDNKKRQEKNKEKVLNEHMAKVTYFRRNAIIVQAVE